MTYSIVWEADPLDAAAGFLRSDPDGVREVFAAVDRLATDPRPDDAMQYGSSDMLRLRVGRYRVLYGVASATSTIFVFHIGRRD
ncbi:MAG TPA: type II toxin-antitoxin system RelE/ParE family toxin [Actinopolymorphaceae bacterium]